MRDVEKRLRRDDRNIWVEPIIPAGNSFIKLDIVLVEGDKLTVLDVSVVSGNRMEESWKLKSEKYGSQCNINAIRKWANTKGTTSQLPVISSSMDLREGVCGERGGLVEI